jgi:MFS family permease
LGAERIDQRPAGLTPDSSATRRGILTGYRGLLGRPEVRWLVIGSMIARLPSAMLPLAILLMVDERTGSLAIAGAVVGVYGVGRAAISPLVGAQVDRVGQLRVLAAGAALQTVLLVALVVATGMHLSPILIPAVALAAGGTVPPIQACLRALWTVVATEGAERETAYSFDATSQELIWIAGPLAVSALLIVASPAMIVILAAAIGGVGVALFAASPISRAWRGRRQRPRFGALGGSNLRALLVTSAFAGINYGALTFGLTALAVGLGNNRASGILLACVSAGSITGGLLYGAWSWRRPATQRYRALLLATAAAGLPLMFASSIALAVPMSLVSGLPLAAVYASMYILTGRAAREGTTTEAFTWTSSAFAFGVSAGTAVAGTAGQELGARSAFALACLAAAAAALLSVLVRDRGA